jgi:hypothetical protein
LSATRHIASSSFGMMSAALPKKRVESARVVYEG